MSSALALAGVSAIIELYLTSMYNSSGLFGGNVKVFARAPDAVQELFTTGTDEFVVNLFMHQVTPNAAWRNQQMPTVGPDGATRLSNQPLALDLHYLITAYGRDDWHAEALLGLALLMLHENPVLTRNDIRNAITQLPAKYGSNSLSGQFSDVGLADQIEMLKITPATLGREEMAWLWTALKADYRPTFPFQVSVVLIEPRHPEISPMPVLLRNITVEPDLTPFPAILTVVPPSSQPAAALGQAVTVTGHHLSAATQVILANPLRGISQTIVPTSTADTSLQFTLPLLNTPADLPAGIYDLSITVPLGLTTTTTNSLPLAIAPSIDTWPGGAIVSGNRTVAVPCTPYVQPGQQVSLIIGDQQAPADVFTVATNAPSFTYPNLLPTGGAVRARMRVDGIESRIVDRTTKPPTFVGPVVTVA
jgi:uncharacterized protein DUF4255